MARSRKSKTTSSDTASDTSEGRSEADAPKVEETVSHDATVEEIADAEVIEEIPADADKSPEEDAGADPDADPSSTAAGDQSPDATAEEDTSSDGAKAEGLPSEPDEAPDESLTDEQDPSPERPTEVEATGDDAAAGSGVSDPEPAAEDRIAEGAADGPVPDQTAQAVATEPPPPQRSFLPLLVAALIGGVIAVTLGFLVDRQLTAMNQVEGPTPLDNAAEITALSARIDDASGQIATLTARDIAGEIDEATAPVSESLSDIEARLSLLTEQFETLAGRVETIAMRPTATGINADEFDDALSEFRDRLNTAIADAQTEIEDARSEAEQISERAYSDEQAALARAAWGQIATALENGQSFEEPLATLTGLTDVDVPEPLAGSAASGVPTLSELQQTFPDAARTALTAAIRAETGDAPMERLTAFLRVQSGVRSLTPREGDDPDAVLSRVEAALRNGDLEAALTEAGGFDGPGREALAEWEAMARARIAALDAASAVSGQLNVN